MKHSSARASRLRAATTSQPPARAHACALQPVPLPPTGGLGSSTFSPGYPPRLSLIRRRVDASAAVSWWLDLCARSLTHACLPVRVSAARLPRPLPGSLWRPHAAHTSLRLYPATAHTGGCVSKSHGPLSHTPPGRSAGPSSPALQYGVSSRRPSSHMPARTYAHVARNLGGRGGAGRASKTAKRQDSQTARESRVVAAPLAHPPPTAWGHASASCVPNSVPRSLTSWRRRSCRRSTHQKCPAGACPPPPWSYP